MPPRGRDVRVPAIAPGVPFGDARLAKEGTPQVLISHHPRSLESSAESPEEPSEPGGSGTPHDLAAGPSGNVLAVGAPGPGIDQLTRTLVSAGHEVSHARPGEV